MRTIKFRGKRIDNGEWVYGDFNHRCGRVVIEDNDKLNSQYVDPNTVGQFTGLFDKKGKEIYELDIIEWTVGRTKFIGVIKIGEYYCESGDVEGYGTYFDNEFVEESFGINCGKASEVIGNINDNPESENCGCLDENCGGFH